jgi:hypothetical protein
MDTAHPSARRRRGRTSLLLAAPILTALVLTGCGSTGSSGSSAGGAADNANLGNTGNTGNAQAPRAADVAASAEKAAGASGVDVQRQVVISTGRVALASPDVTATRDRLDGVLTQVHGRVADEDTSTNDDGTVTRSHLVVRVPSRHFDAAMTSLAGIAELRSSSRTAEDVTTRVIDLGARIKAERAGVQRLRRLVSSTADLRALLAVERELSTRQGNLDSLRQQRAYLTDQASTSTITVDVTRRTAPAPAPAKATGGFLGGLNHGWHGLVAVVTGLLLALGAALPFLIALGLVGTPAWFVVRRARRLRAARAPAES